MGDDKETVLITGASSGIGEALAWVFAEHGHDMILVARSVDKLDALADELVGEYEVMVSVRSTDLSQAGSAESLARALHREGRQVDILVNNAGVLEHGTFVYMAPEDHQRMLQLNVTAPMQMAKQVLCLGESFAAAPFSRGPVRFSDQARLQERMPRQHMPKYR